jgi:hypothetical protein
MSRKRLAVAVLVTGVVVGVFVGAVLVSDAGPGAKERIAACSRIEPRARCEYLEQEKILCDSGYPFCGHADSAARRIFLCEEAAKSYGEDPRDCAGLERADELCDDGGAKDHDPLVGEGPRCEQFEHRNR